MYSIIEKLNECQIKIHSNLNLEEALAQGELLQSLGKSVKIVRSANLQNSGMPLNTYI